jgi:uncharacterized membrane protein YidH (DUF202 family)
MVGMGTDRTRDETSQTFATSINGGTRVGCGPPRRNASPPRMVLEVTDSRALFDEGLQVERTALAWRRTSLSTVVATLAVSRTVLAHGYEWSIAAMVLGVILCVTMFTLGASRHWHVHRHYDSESTNTAALLPPTWPIFAIALICAVLGAGTVVFALT